MKSGLYDSILSRCVGAVYVFDADVLRERTAKIRAAMPENVSLCYAVKANTFIIKELIGSVDSFEICSPGEERICERLGVPSEKMVISGVYKTPSVIERTVADKNFAGIFTAESILQFEQLCEYSRKYGTNIRVLLRLTNDSQFGINGEDIENIISRRAEYGNVEISGIQFFSGTQKTSVKKLRREIEKLDAFLVRLSEEYGYVAKELEYGTGFPVSYYEGEDFDEDAYFAAFAEMLTGMNTRAHITLEIGRSIAATCGKYFTHIVDTKCNKGQNYAICDGGMHQIVYFGQYMAMKHPSMSLYSKTPQGDKRWNVCGSLCSMNDIIVKEASLGDLEVGDVLCFNNTGAYCPTEGMSLFLSRDLPAVYIISRGKILEVRKAYETCALNTPDYN
ncbi:MAG: diaminopimelate decarboxylase family protein [Candidatus Avispirillum sp.]